MILKLFKTVDSDNVINKTITDELSININLKRDVDIVNPVIDLYEITGIELDSFNYAEIPDLKRFYIVAGTELVHNKILRFSLECDILESYKNEILNSFARFNRNIKVGDYENGQLITSNKNTITKHFSDKGLEIGEQIVMNTIKG